MGLIKLVTLLICSQYRVFHLFSWPWVWMEGLRGACATSSSHKFQLVQSCFVTNRKNLEEVDLVDKTFLN